MADVPGIAFCAYDDSEWHNHHYIIVECEAGLETLSRDELMSALQQENVLARRYFYPGCHQMEPYRSMFPWAIFRLRNTRQLADRVLALPNGDSVSDGDIRNVCAILRLARRTPPRSAARCKVCLRAINDSLPRREAIGDPPAKPEDSRFRSRPRICAGRCDPISSQPFD